MANSFDFELTANDEASAAILRIEEVVKSLNPLLDKTRDALALGGQDSRDNLDELGSRFDVLARNARSGVQFIGDLVPPLKMVGGLTLGLGGASAVVNVVKNNLTNFANTGYRIDTIAKNVSMTADAFQELTGAMVENGSAREAAEDSVGDLFEKANDAAHGRNDGFLALLKQRGVEISLTKEGLADVGKLVNDLNRAMQSLPAGQQALFANKMGISPELLSYLRHTTSEVQRLKDQARRDGLIFSDKDLQNALAFKQQLNQIGAAYDGMLMKGQAWLGQSETLRASVDQVTQIMSHGLDSTAVGSILTFNRGGKQADIIRNAKGDDKFKETLSWKEKLDLELGYASEDLIKKLNEYYKPVWRADQLKGDMEKAIMSPASSVNSVPSQAPYSEAGRNSRGLRNNNAGNVRAAPNAVGHDGGFPIFANPRDGNAALARQLMLYGDRGNNTLNGIIHTYAPSKENNTQAYINAVSKMTGFSPYDRLDLHSPETLQKLLPAIIKHENGTQPFSSEDINLAIDDSVNDDRWRGLRDSRKLLEQRQSGLFDYESPVLLEPDKKEITPSKQDSLFAPNTEGKAEIGQVTEAISKAINENKFQLEVTMINSQTGDRHKVNTEGGGRVALPMQYN
ncbi:hypothetical protein MNO11_15320 [Serratia plymuthica]|uniref:hypothetical protein n=1 Tax=Serratia plymuthica TaxID=82996 RepID=UPI001F53CDF1|nr:hypothetical protein [Serratia plymuthica]UNK26215.1 hypothetical protein MNO11_15320 [Serratia plymuthica]